MSLYVREIARRRGHHIEQVNTNHFVCIMPDHRRHPPFRVRVALLLFLIATSSAARRESSLRNTKSENTGSKIRYLRSKGGGCAASPPSPCSSTDQFRAQQPRPALGFLEQYHGRGTNSTPQFIYHNRCNIQKSYKTAVGRLLAGRDGRSKGKAKSVAINYARLKAVGGGGPRAEGDEPYNPGEEGGGTEAGRRRRARRPLLFLSQAVNAAVLEMCVENEGRPLAMAMTDMVERAVEAFVSGYSMEAMLLELQMLDSTTRIPGKTLTAVEKRYRTQWLETAHFVLQNLGFVEQREPKNADEHHLKSQVDVVLRGRQTRDEQTFVKFDMALATGGVSGGAATERIVIPPQVVPISQLVLLAIRALQKMEDKENL